MSRYPILGSSVLVLGLLSVACGSSSGSSPTTPTAPGSSGTVTINILGQAGNMSFAPNPAAVKVGQAVVFHNADSITHAPVQDSGSTGGGGGGYGGGGGGGTGGFSAGQVGAGQTSVALTFSTAGNIGYHCNIHPNMVGMLVVTP
jgi:plastocyanin